MLAWRLLGSFPGSTNNPTPTYQVLTAKPHGGYNHWSIAAALQDSGTAFIGYVSGTTGNIEVIERDEATGVITGPTVVHAALEADAHDSPAMLIRSSDSRIVAIYSRHNNGELYRRISTNALDSTAWGTETNIDSQVGGTRYTNAQLHQLNAEVNDPIYMYFRNEPTAAGTDSRWQLSKSTDGGSTWGTMANIYHIPSNRSYLVSWSNGQDRIDFLATAAFASSPYKLGHFYYEAGDYHTSDGTIITSPPIQSFSEITQIYSGTDQVWPGQVAIDTDGTPVMLYYTWDGALWTYWYARWDGSAWNSTAFVIDTPAYNYNPGGNDGMYGAAIDDASVNIVYGLRAVGVNPEWFKWVTTDDGATFTETQLTSGSAIFQATPIPVRNRGSKLAVIANYGTWNHYTSFNMGTNGLVAP